MKTEDIVDSIDIDKNPIEIKSLENIRSRLESLKWLIEKKIFNEIIADITALLVSLDTTTQEGKDFNKAVEVIASLLTKPIEEGFVFFQCIQDTDNKPFIIISPDKSFAASIFLNATPKTIHAVLFHAHIDVVNTTHLAGQNSVKLATNKFTCTEYMFGRGTNDMKAQVALMIMLIHYFYYMQNSNFCCIISSDEEIFSPRQKEYIRRIKNTGISIDLEPNGHSTGFVDQVSTEPSLTFVRNEFISWLPDINSTEYRQVKDSFLKIIKIRALSVLNKKYINTKFKINIMYYGSVLEVNISPEPREELEEIARLVKNDFKKYFDINCRTDNTQTSSQTVQLMTNHTYINLINRVFKDLNIPKRYAEFPSKIATTRESADGYALTMFEAGFGTALTCSFEKEIVNKSRAKSQLMFSSIIEEGERHSQTEMASFKDLNSAFWVMAGICNQAIELES